MSDSMGRRGMRRFRVSGPRPKPPRVPLEVVVRVEADGGRRRVCQASSIFDGPLTSVQAPLPGSRTRTL